MNSLQTTLTSNNRYHLLEPLGAGGMGIVYRAKDRLTGQDVALKKVKIPIKDLMFASRADNSDHSLALAQEFRTLASLRHPNIVSVLDYGFDEKRVPFFTMDLLADAKNVVSAAENLPLTGKLDLLLQMLQALAYLHRRGIFHRDLKPENVMVIKAEDGSNVVKLLDFGLSLYSDKSEAELSEKMAGTIAYMAPEILMGKPASRGADLYAFGMIAYEIFAGQYPFDKSTLPLLLISIVNQTPDIEALDLNDDLKSFIEKLLSKTREERYRSATGAMQSLTSAADLEIPMETVVIRESFLQTANFVGRQAEMALLNKALLEAHQGKSSVWLVGAESGVGKSRLLKEFRIQAIVAGWQVFQGQAIANGGSTYQLWQDILPLLALNTELSELEASVLNQISPTISKIYSHPIPELANLDDEAAQQRLLSTIVNILQRQESPTLLLLEDLQWSFESLAPINQILRVLDKLSRVMVVCTYRRDERPNLPTELAEAKVIRLNNLIDEEVAQLSQAMLGGKLAKRKDLISLLQKETEGNAFFLVETVRALAEEAGALDEIPEMVVPTEKIFTGGMTQLIQRRLNQVPPEGQQLLKIAAVAGRSIDLNLLQSISSNTPLELWLSQCEEAAVLDVQDNRWQFSHDKLRELLLSELTDEERKSTHLQVAVGLMNCYPDDPSKAGNLAQLWNVIGDHEKEAQFALIAGKQAVANFSNEEALIFFNRTFELLDKSDKQLLFEVLRYRERTYDNLANREAQKQDLIQLVELAEGMGVAEKGFSALQQAEYYQVTSDFDPAIEKAQSAIEYGKQLSDPNLISQSYLVWGTTLQQKGRYDQANEVFLKGLEVARKANNKKQEAYCLDGLGFSTGLQGNLDESIEYHELSLAIFREIGDRWGEGLGLGNLAGMLGDKRDYVAAQAKFEMALSIAREIGNIYDAGLILNDIGIFKEQQGQYAIATKQYEMALEIHNEVGNRWGAGISISNLASVHLKLSNHLKASQLFEEALKIAIEIDNLERTVFCLIGLGQIAIEQGELSKAEKYFQEGLGLDHQQLREYTPIELAAGFAQLHLAHGDKSLANEAVQQIVDYLQINPQLDGLENRMRLFRQTWETLLALDRIDDAQQVLALAMQEIDEYLTRYEDLSLQEMYLSQQHHKFLWEAKQST